MDEAAATATMTLTVQCTDANKFSVTVPMDTTVVEFKALIASQASCPAEQQRLIHRGRVLRDEATLESYGTCLVVGRGLRPRARAEVRKVYGALRPSRLCRPPHKSKQAGHRRVGMVVMKGRTNEQNAS